MELLSIVLHDKNDSVYCEFFDHDTIVHMRALKKQQFGLTFSDRVVRCAREVPKGRVTTYGRIARAAGGGAMASRSVTQILAKAWNAGVHDIPWHRIVYANGTAWIDAAHEAERNQLYKKEGIQLDAHNRIVNFLDIVYEYK